MGSTDRRSSAVVGDRPGVPGVRPPDSTHWSGVYAVALRVPESVRRRRAASTIVGDIEFVEISRGDFGRPRRPTLLAHVREQL